MDPKTHWETVYTAKSPMAVSWFQPQARLSLELVTAAAPDRVSRILDVGGGASRLVDGLLDLGYSRVTVLDIAEAALQHARERLGPRATEVTWLAGDIRSVALDPASVDLWHDRAVFHFLVDAVDRRRYVDQVRRALRPGGIVIVATFADDGPQRCSGLDVARYSPEELHGEFGDDFRLLRSEREEHQTPSGAVQAFTYCLCRGPLP
jgi:SAM-dependent methyltransferase